MASRDGEAASSYGLNAADGALRGQRGPRARACAQCKRHKLRCEYRPRDMTCVRCTKMNVDCSPHDPVQRLLDGHSAWRAQASAQIAQLQTTVAALSAHTRLPDSPNFRRLPTSPQDSTPGKVTVTESLIAPVDARSDSSGEDGEDTCLVQAPMYNLYELSKATNRSEHRVSSSLGFTLSELDPIARGLVTLVEGEGLFQRFKKNIHSLLWGGVLLPHPDFAQVRKSSAILTSAILAIGALHAPEGGGQGVLQKCYDTFIVLAKGSCFSRNNSLDDIRALCLAAFYLPNLSWRLCGQAMRIGAEMNLHQSFNKLVQGDLRQIERIRLWYALFLCDRHFGIAYGRPTAMPNDAAIEGVFKLPQCPNAVPGDVRLAAHVALFKIVSDAYTEYGCDQSLPLSDYQLDKLRAYNVAIEQWRLYWEPQSNDAEEIGSYPSKSLVLYYHFARFQLHTMALRGVQWPGDGEISLSRREATMSAISAAMSTLVHIICEADIRRALNGVPLFTHTMVAFCATFLLKVAAMWTHGREQMWKQLGLGFNPHEALSLASQSTDLLSGLAGEVSEKHVTRLIVVGIEEMIQRVKQMLASNASASGPCSTFNVERDPHFQADPQLVDQAAAPARDINTVLSQHDMDFSNLGGWLEFPLDQNFDIFGNGYDPWAFPI